MVAVLAARHAPCRKMRETQSSMCAKCVSLIQDFDQV